MASTLLRSQTVGGLACSQVATHLAPKKAGNSAASSTFAGVPLRPHHHNCSLHSGSLRSPSQVAPLAFFGTKNSEGGAAAATLDPPVPDAKEAFREAFEQAALSSPIPRASATAHAIVKGHFPGAMEQETFVECIGASLRRLGFTKENSIPLVNTCRDEICRPIVKLIDDEFGHSFNISGLGGLITCGVTGMKAGLSHSPQVSVGENTREKYIFFAFPHIAISEEGKEGEIRRGGRAAPSSACGALIAVRSAIGALKDAKPEDNSFPADDFEFALLKTKIIAKRECMCCSYNRENPSLIEVTRAAEEVIRDDLEDLIAKTVDPKTADYAVITGVHIHSGDQVPGEPYREDRAVDYIAPDTMYAVVNGSRYMFYPVVPPITTINHIKYDKAATA